MKRVDGAAFIEPDDIIEVDGKKIRFADITDPKIRAILDEPIKLDKKRNIRYTDSSGKQHTISIQDQVVAVKKYQEVSDVSGKIVVGPDGKKYVEVPESIAKKFENGPVEGSHRDIRDDRAVDITTKENLVLAIRKNTEGVRRMYEEIKTNGLKFAGLLLVPIVLLPLLFQCGKDANNKIEVPNYEPPANTETYEREEITTIIKEEKIDLSVFNDVPQHFHGIISAFAQEASTADALKGQGLFDKTGKYDYTNQEELEKYAAGLFLNIQAANKTMNFTLSQYLQCKQEYDQARNREERRANNLDKRMNKWKTAFIQSIEDLKGLTSEAREIAGIYASAFVDESQNGDFADESSNVESVIVVGHLDKIDGIIAQSDKMIEQFSTLIEQGSARVEDGKLIIEISSTTRETTKENGELPGYYEEDTK